MKKSAAKKVVKKPAKKLPSAKKTTVPTHRSSSASVSAGATKPSAQVPKPSNPLNEPQVVADHQRRTAILFSRSVERVEYTVLDVENGLEVLTADPRDFDGRYKPLVDYPVKKAAALYVEYARGLGATEQVMKKLGKLTTVNQEDIEMATKKKAARAAAPVKTAKKATKKTVAPAKATKGEKPAKASKAPAEKKERKERGPTAAKRFQELIMEKSGKTCAHTDDQIFAKVQKEFGLDDSKKSYVKWYRNYLTKQGQNPPVPKE